MITSSCIFCGIIENNKNILYENSQFIIIENIVKEKLEINKEPIQLLIIPKVHSNCFDKNTLKKAIDLAYSYISQNNLKSYKFTANTGHPFQTVFHSHLHLQSFNE